MIGWVLLATAAVAFVGVKARPVLAALGGLVEWEGRGRKVSIGSPTSLALISTTALGLGFVGAVVAGVGSGGPPAPPVDPPTAYSAPDAPGVVAAMISDTSGYANVTAFSGSGDDTLQYVVIEFDSLRGTGWNVHVDTQTAATGHPLVSDTFFGFTANDTFKVRAFTRGALSAQNSAYSVTDTFVATFQSIAVGNLFSARWDYAVGDSQAAVTDNGLFDGTFSNGVNGTTGVVTLDVVTAASVGANTGTLASYTGGVLRQRMAEGGYGQMTADTIIPASTSHYGRVYYRSDAGRRSQHGSGYIVSAAGGSFNHWQILSLEHNGGSTASDPLQWSIRTAGTYPTGRYYSPSLSKGTWYRFEWYVEYVTATTVKVWPRIYDLTGTLLYDSDDFRDDDGGSSLTTFWASNTLTIGAPDDTADATEARNFTVGLEDPSNAVGYNPGTPAYIYFAALDFSTTGWLGN